MIRLNRHLTSTVSRLARPRVGVTSDNMIIGKRAYLFSLYICLIILELGWFPFWCPAGAECCRHFVTVSSCQAEAANTESHERGNKQ